MTGRSKPKRAAPIALRWLAALRDDDELPRDNPGRVAVIAVGSVLMSYADSDGRNCYPAIDTIVTRAGVSKRTARLVVRWLVDAEWLAVTAKANQRRPTVYRLTILGGAEEHPLDEAQTVPRSTPWNGSGGAPGGAPGGAEEHPDLLPPNVSEEEEGASARSANAPLAAPEEAEPVEDIDCPSAANPHVAAIKEISATVDVVNAAAKAKVGPAALDASKLGPAFAVALANSEWPEAVLVVYCVEKLTRRPDRIGDPTAFLATDLTTRVNKHVTMTARMSAAVALEQFWDLEDELLEPEDGVERLDPHSTPGQLARGELARAGVIEDALDGVPELWEVNPRHLEQFVDVINDVVADTRRRLAEADAARARFEDAKARAAKAAAEAAARQREHIDTTTAFQAIGLPRDASAAEAAASLAANQRPVPSDEVLIRALEWHRDPFGDSE